MDTQGTSEARERVLLAAERLFSERGYAAVTMKDVAEALGMRQASLYHHAPGGKEQLFTEVMQRGFARHSVGLRQAIDAAEPGVRAQLCVIARWLLGQPPLDLTRLFRSDLPAISSGSAEQLLQVVVDALFEPIKEVLRRAYERGEIRAGDYKALAISFLAIVETVHDMQRYVPTPKEALADDMIDVLLDGLRRR